MEARDKLITAIREHDNSGVRKIVDNMTSEVINESDEFGTTALHVACGAANNHEAVRKLLNVKNPPVNVKGKGGFTPIMVAVGYCSTECLQLLLQDPKVDLDLTDKRGQRLEDLVAIAKGCTASNRQREEVRHWIKEERERRAREDLGLQTEQVTDSLENIDLNEGDKGIDNMDAARNNLECPVCFNEMRPPLKIWMCSSTHAICEICKNKLKNDICPTCKSSRVSIRAFFAENIARSLFEKQ